MTENHGGVIVTVREMYDELQRVSDAVSELTNTVKTDIETRTKSDIEGRVRKIEQQNAAHWVIHTIFLGVIALGIERLFT